MPTLTQTASSPPASSTSVALFSPSFSEPQILRSIRTPQPPRVRRSTTSTRNTVLVLYFIVRVYIFCPVLSRKWSTCIVLVYWLFGYNMYEYYRLYCRRIWWSYSAGNTCSIWPPYRRRPTPSLLVVKNRRTSASSVIAKNRECPKKNHKYFILICYFLIGGFH